MDLRGLSRYDISKNNELVEARDSENWVEDDISYVNTRSHTALRNHTPDGYLNCALMAQSLKSSASKSSTVGGKKKDRVYVPGMYANGPPIRTVEPGIYF